MSPEATEDLETALRLVAELEPSVLNIGHGRDPESVARAETLGRAWSDRGGVVGRIVSWPATAASWLRPASRLAGDADAWLIADRPDGWRDIAPRLAATDSWDAARTVLWLTALQPTRADRCSVEVTDADPRRTS
ncbi:hypothetical protein [Pseudonocardia spinosispora]|uniref:hypothetical protein n=1 Tax=Pseudonocardia spinosispora TaxID=103441 RepID=UPI0004195ACF|nr:hypothetical protein [Pseudonocardia spinosispora]